MATGVTSPERTAPPRARLLSDAAGAVTRGRPVVIIGTAGIGKTEFARALARAVRRPIVWVLGDEKSAAAPLAAVSACVESSPDPGSGPSGPAETTASAALCSRIEATGALLVVDGAEHLDDASARVVAGLIPRLPGRVVVLSNDQALGPALYAALRTADAQIVDVPPLTLDETAALIGDLRHHRPDLTEAMRIHRAADGNPRHVRHLASSAQRPPGSATELEYLAAAVLAAATAPERDLLGFLAVASPLSLPVLGALGLADAVDAAAGRLVTVDGGLVRSAHGVPDPVIAGRLGVLHLRRLTERLVDALDRDGRSPADLLHRARLADWPAGEPAEGRLAATLIGDLLGDRLADALTGARSLRATGPASAIAAYTEAEILRRLGESRRPRILARAALTDGTPESPLTEAALRHTLVAADVAFGSLDEAAADARPPSGPAPQPDLVLAYSCFTAALPEIARGAFAEAGRRLDAALELAAEDRTGIACAAAAELAAVRMMLGDPTAVERAVARARASAVDAVSAAALHLCEAFATACRGQSTRPRQLFRLAARNGGHVADAFIALTWAVRFGDRAAAELITDPALRCEGPAARTVVAQAVALRSRDGDALIRAAEGYARLGLSAHAADALAQGMIALRAAGHSVAANALRGRLDDLVAACDGITSPAIRVAVTGAVLTDREAEVLAMTALGGSRRAVGEALGILPTSVSAYLVRAHQKIDAAVSR